MSILVEQLIKANEGFRDKVYTCTEGKATIGYGTNLEDRGISEDEAHYLLVNDIDSITFELNQKGFKGIFDEAREAVLYDMAYQMGCNGLFQFKRMLSALIDGDYQQAAHELMDSKYARQTPNRALRNAEILRTGKIEG